MPDRMSVSFLTAAFQKEMAAKVRSIDRSQMWALRQAARQGQRTAKKTVRVYQGDGPNVVSIAAVKRARKAGVTLTGERLGRDQTVEKKNQVVKGLLRDSIRVGRVTPIGRGTYRVRFGPWGPRVYKYAKKIEDLDHYMAQGKHASEAGLVSAMSAAVERVWR